MLGREDHQQSFFGTGTLLEHLFDSDSFYAKLAQHGPDIVTDEDFADLYHPTKGRPSIPPAQMMRAVLLAFHDGCSDREASRRSTKDLDWKHALGLAVDAPGFHATTFSVFRARLVVHDADRRVFDLVLRRAIEAGLFPRRATALVDSSAVFGAAAVKDTYELIRAAIARVVRAAGPDSLTKRVRRATRRYCSSHKPRINWDDKTARRAEVARMVAAADALLAATAARPDLAEARELLERIVGQDVERDPDDGGGPRIRRGVAKDRVVSVADPEMRHGRKSASARFDGYKVHVATDEQTELVTAVDVGAATEWDGQHAAGLVANAKASGVPPARMIGDTAYGDADTRVAVAAEGAQVVAKVPPQPPNGRFGREDFFVYATGRKVMCPAGVTTTDRRSATDHKGRPVTRFVFDAKACAGCELRTRCTTSAEGRVLTLGYQDQMMQAARRYQRSPHGRRMLRRRAPVERKIGELKHHGIGKARYRGKRRVLLQAYLTAAAVNVKRLFTLGIDDRRPCASPA